ncbi:MAG TPA: nucleoside hydrolase [Homoserinimonas sp.]|nr:nucleoside hydrolase [Homoserinimonas sp.]
MRTRAVLAAMAVVLLGTAGAQQKVILDTDFNTFGDDGQVFIMISQLHAEGVIDLLGVTVVSGNQWLDQEVADALKAVERMGMQDEVQVYAGAEYPLVHDFDTYEQERQLFGFGYAGAWRNPKPTEAELEPPFDGFAKEVQLADQNAVQFIIEQVRQFPGEIDFLVIGPVTNIALAIRQDPDIVDMFGRVIFMGGAIDVVGNVTPAAEFNWWFDPESVKIAVREPLDMTIVPLDVTNTVQFSGAEYERIVNDEVPSTVVTEMFRDRFAEDYAGEPDFQANIWDTLTVAALVDPSLIGETVEVWIDMDDTFGPNYGRSIGYYDNPPEGLQQATVVKTMNEEAFWDFYIDLMTRPVPVAMGE